MNVCRAILFFKAAVLIYSAVPLGAANLVPWFTMSNTWHTVPTNEIVGRAASGEGEAQCYLGKAFFEGLRGFPTNFIEARQWLLKSAEQDVAQAQNTLGWNAANGIGMREGRAPADYQRPERFFDRTYLTRNSPRSPRK